MANENELPAQPAPSSAVSPAKPISLASLRQEITATPPGDLPPPRAELKPKPAEAPEPKGSESPTVPGFREAIRKRVMDKADAPETAKPEPKVEPVAKAEPKSEAKPTPDPVKDAEVPEDHKRVLPHDKPDTARRIKAILAEKAKFESEAKAARDELEAAKKAAPSAANNEEIEKLRKEHETAQADLMRFRRRYEIDNDPEFTAKYREPVKQVEKSIEDSLKKYGIGDATLEVVRKEGGFASFSRSNRLFTVHEADPENEGKTRPVQRTAAQLARSWLNDLPAGDSEFIRASIGKQQLLQSEEQVAIHKAQDEAKTYFDSQTASQREASAKAQEAQQKATKEYEEWVGKTESTTEFLKDRPLPENASPEQKKEIEDFNEFNAQLRASLKKHPTTALEYGQLKLEAAEAHHLRRTVGSKDAEIARLQKELERVKGASRTTPKGGSLLTSATKAQEPKPSADPTDFKSALRARVMRGQGSIDE